MLGSLRFGAVHIYWEHSSQYMCFYSEVLSYPQIHVFVLQHYIHFKKKSYFHLAHKQKQ